MNGFLSVGSEAVKRKGGVFNKPVAENCTGHTL